MAKSPLILALDSPDIERCRALIQSTRDFIEVYKFGLEFFTANGPSAIAEFRRGFPDIRIFLDLKLHDIPNTVGKASQSLRPLEVEFLTVHCAGGAEMINAAVSALPGTRITGVTVLTSLDATSLRLLGLGGEVKEFVLRWAKEAVAAGATAIVASPHEVAMLRKELSREIALITPGIRPILTTDDQKRTMTPRDAILAGADYLVIGRPITASPDPQEAARSIFESLA